MSSLREKYEAVIGLEVHAQLLTHTKLFCGCANEFGASPNTNICPVCTGQPGALPVINREAISLGIRAALVTHSTVHEKSVFARKNYFYPDLPKGYQISQFERPYCSGGHVKISLKSGETKQIGLTRIHFEEDAGKSVHDPRGTLVNLNRAGVPLVEIVSEPDIRSAEEASQYLKKLRSLLRYAEVSDADMEKGNFRCDVNISVRLKGEAKLGTKVELKNINSFRFIEKAIEFEIDRQIDLVEDGQSVKQQTRSWNADRNYSEVMREKEEAHDYRYFPEPDLPVLNIDPKWQQVIEQQIPEMPDEKRERFKKSFGLKDYDADFLTASRDVAEYFEAVAEGSKNAKLSANWVMNELMSALNESSLDISQSKVAASALADLIRRIDGGEISGKIAKSVFAEMISSGKAPAEIIQEKGLRQINDEDGIKPILLEILKNSPNQVAQYQSGKTKLLGYFVGQVMKATKGQANPELVNKLVKEALDKN